MSLCHRYDLSFDLSYGSTLYLTSGDLWWPLKVICVKNMLFFSYSALSNLIKIIYFFGKCHHYGLSFDLSYESSLYMTSVDLWLPLVTLKGHWRRNNVFSYLALANLIKIICFFANCHRYDLSFDLSYGSTFYLTSGDLWWPWKVIDVKIMLFSLWHKLTSLKLYISLVYVIVMT